jgi:hypothetical protein
MRRLTHAFVVAMLALSASGVSGLVVAEPCTGDEPPGQADTACFPTCATCGCCAQTVEPAALVAVGSRQVLLAEIETSPAGLPLTDPRPILHVPKRRLA